METWTLLDTPLSVIGGVIIGYFLTRKDYKENMKLDVLRRILKYRYALTDKYRGSEYNPARAELNCVLNEAVIVFHRNKKIVRLLRAFYAGYTERNMNALIKEMCEDIKKKTSSKIDDLIDNPLALSVPGE